VPAKPFLARIADSFTAFEAAARQFGGDSCAAGLLNHLTGGGCGIHPSAAGQALLAAAVERIVNTRRERPAGRVGTHTREGQQCVEELSRRRSLRPCNRPPWPMLDRSQTRHLA